MDKWTGVLRLSMEKKRDKTVTKQVYFQGAFKMLRPHYLDNSGQACYFLINPGGGYVDGDRYRMEITLEEQAELILTTQSATKVYRTPHTPVLQENEIILKKGSVLEYIPDPLIAYRDAKYKQNTIIQMERGATLFYSDILTPGWSPDGEWFRYDLLQLKNEIYLDEKLIMFDHLKLQPDEAGVDGIGYMEGYTHLGSMIVMSEQVNEDVLQRLYSVIGKDLDECKAGLSLLIEGGFTLRILAHSTQKIEELMAACSSFLRKEWYDRDPVALRKY
ncbi:MULTISPECIES: urease accessory protein UreD [Bacillaceae]|uniref:Urease accessory protein UreD n=1 Tax=Domibacillus aminovorans TaxID=29332 RepID=A0A177KYD1_9BACI|nr:MULTISPECIES: urease accessory protein UreD [Bacillaceae]OAH58418.1 urease accessory protein UreD [Domibacillus aminovorans]